jgi:hypothetical protein
LSTPKAQGTIAAAAAAVFSVAVFTATVTVIDGIAATAA